MTEKPQTKNKQEFQVFKVSNDKTVILYKPLNLVCLQSNREPAHKEQPHLSPSQINLVPV